MSRSELAARFVGDMDALCRLPKRKHPQPVIKHLDSMRRFSLTEDDYFRSPPFDCPTECSTIVSFGCFMATLSPVLG
jgi:hypothetical protein